MIDILLQKHKIYKDVIYSSIETTYLANLIIDTDIFQRLRHLNQLGVCFLIFPNANNKRFEHSLGVYHLTDCLIDKIIKNSKKEHLNNEIIKVPFIKNYLTRKHSLPKDGLKFYAHFKNESLFDDYLIELIKIAGLVHDLGHGPFSHLFDEWLKEDSELHDNQLLEHESRSKALLLEILKDKKVKIEGKDMTLFDFIDEEAYNFICELIEPDNTTPDNFIFQIISNIKNGFDVDKLDYILRDSFYLDQRKPYNLDSIISQCAVVGGKMSFPEKLSPEILQVYLARYNLHKLYYNHKTVVSIEFVILEILKNIDKLIKIKEDFKNMSLNKFKSLNDNVILFFTKSIRLMNKKINEQEDVYCINKIDELISDLNTRNIPKCLFLTSFPIYQEKQDDKEINPEENDDFNKGFIESSDNELEEEINENVNSKIIVMNNTETEFETELETLRDDETLYELELETETNEEDDKNKEKDKKKKDKNKIRKKLKENIKNKENKINLFDSIDETKLLKQCSERNNVPKSKLKIVKKVIGLLSGDKSHPFDNMYFINKKNRAVNIPKTSISICMPITHREEILIVYKMTDNLCSK